MAALTLNRLKQIIADSYEAGYHGSLDLKEIYVEEIVDNVLDPTEETFAKNDGWKTFKVSELRGLRIGTIFDHATRGKCFIESDGLNRYMKFANGSVAKFLEDSSPWDEPMRIIGNSSKIPPHRQKRLPCSGDTTLGEAAVTLY